MFLNKTVTETRLKNRNFIGIRAFKAQVTDSEELPHNACRLLDYCLLYAATVLIYRFLVCWSKFFAARPFTEMTDEKNHQVQTLHGASKVLVVLFFKVHYYMSHSVPL